MSVQCAASASGAEGGDRGQDSTSSVTLHQNVKQELENSNVKYGLNLTVDDLKELQANPKVVKALMAVTMSRQATGSAPVMGVKDEPDAEQPVQMVRREQRLMLSVRRFAQVANPTQIGGASQAPVALY